MAIWYSSHRKLIGKRQGIERGRFLGIPFCFSNAAAFRRTVDETQARAAVSGRRRRWDRAKKPLTHDSTVKNADRTPSLASLECACLRHFDCRRFPWDSMLGVATLTGGCKV